MQVLKWVVVVLKIYKWVQLYPMSRQEKSVNAQLQKRSRGNDLALSSQSAAKSISARMRHITSHVTVNITLELNQTIVFTKQRLECYLTYNTTHRYT